jgi:geranylgeranyl diphosphate synthase type II
MAEMQVDLESLRELINVRLGQLVPETSATSPAAAARHSLLAPGKRLRAIITLTAARSHGGSIEDALDAACAIEMLHSASLVFDDLPAMDDADLRRGMPTAHCKFGQDIAILAGIGLMNGAYEVVAKSRALTPEHRLELLRIITHAVGWQGLVHGQALDLTSGEGGAAVDAIHEGKTGALFIAAAECGGICADASDEVRRDLRAFGRALGLAYQAFDDCLDQASCAETTGKTTGRDGGKKTAVLGARQGLYRAEVKAEGHIDAAIEAVGASTALAAIADAVRRHFKAAIAA